MYKEESDLACIVKQLKEDPDLLNQLVAVVPALRSEGGPPSIEVLAAFKDKMRISDQNWPEAVKMLGLGPYASISAIRKQRQQDNMSMEIQPVGTSGYEIPLVPYLQHLLQQNPPSNPSKPVIVIPLSPVCTY